MPEITIERLQERELEAFRLFCRENWPGEHPLIHNHTMFEYYYRDRDDGGLNLAIAHGEDGTICGVCGYMKTNGRETPDIWMSYLLAKKGGAPGLGFRLLGWIQQETRCRTIACNNIRANTRALYEFQGWHVADMTQYYRLNPQKENYTICNISTKKTQSVEESEYQWSLLNKQELEALNFAAFAENKPYKDRSYLEKRYFDHPWLHYDVYAAREHGIVRALLVVRQIDSALGRAIRVVDYIGNRDFAAGCGAGLDRLMQDCGADFCDWFAFGLDDETMARAGFCARTADDPNVIPLYLEPPKLENVTITMCTSDPDGYTMFRADGDQDRPNFG